MYYIQHCFICRPSDSTVSEDAEIEPRTVATSALAVSHAYKMGLTFFIVDERNFSIMLQLFFSYAKWL